MQGSSKSYLQPFLELYTNSHDVDVIGNERGNEKDKIMDVDKYDDNKDQNWYQKMLKGETNNKNLKTKLKSENSSIVETPSRVHSRKLLNLQRTKAKYRQKNCLNN